MAFPVRLPQGGDGQASIVPEGVERFVAEPVGPWVNQMGLQHRAP